MSEIGRRAFGGSVVVMGALAVMALGTMPVDAAPKTLSARRPVAAAEAPSRRGIDRDDPNPPGTITWSTPNASGNLGGPNTGGGGGGGK